MRAYDRCQDEQLLGAIENYIQDKSAGDFNALALRLFARHYALNEPYRVYCQNTGNTPASVGDWMDIPAVPARAFKLAALSCVPADQAAAVFYSSGTTEGQPSRNYLDSSGLRLYESSLRAGFDRVAPGKLKLLALMQSPKDAPHSSLSRMLGALNADDFFWSVDDRNRLIASLDSHTAEGEPVCLFSTAFALLDLFDHTPTRRWRLPAGSKVIETGGFKGRTRQVRREEFYSLIEERLGVASPHAFAEYGMSEMASQYYSDGEGCFSGAHWVRARVIDPVSDADASEGILRHFDLANWNSVSAIQTQDMGQVVAPGKFRLLGRAPEAELRGCSLTMEEQWQTLAAG